MYAISAGSQSLQALSLLLACWSHKAEARMSPSLMLPRLEPYINTWQSSGWHCAAVMTYRQPFISIALSIPLADRAHLLQLFHVVWLDVDNVERVVANARVP